MLKVKVNTSEWENPDTTQGPILARFADIYDNGYRLKRFQLVENIERQVAIVWLLNQRMKKDGRHFAYYRFVKMSGDSRSSLRKMVDAVMGRPLSDEEFAMFDLESLIGKYCLLSLVTKESKGKEFVNLAAIMQAPGAMIQGNEISLEGFESPRRKEGFSTLVVEPPPTVEEYNIWEKTGNFERVPVTPKIELPKVALPVVGAVPQPETITANDSMPF